MEQAAYKLSIVIFTDEADPSDLLQAIQDAGESIASDYYGECPEMDGANAMVQCLDETPTSNTITLGSTKLDRVRQQRDELLAALRNIQALAGEDCSDKYRDQDMANDMADMAGAAIAKAEGGA